MSTKTLFQHGLVRLLTAVILIAGILFLGVGLRVQASSQQADPKKDLVGTWRMNVTLYDCSTHQERPAFQSLVTFAEGKVVMETTSSPAFQPGQRSPGHGIWSAKSDRTYSFVTEAYILFTTEPNPPAPGFQKGVQRITQAVKVQGDQLTTDGTVEFFDAGGKLVMKGCAKSTGARMGS